jgi:cellulose synthase/poly-beta-1,6-N-acetylglucosamine synthase-like glycosyltransferase
VKQYLSLTLSTLLVSLFLIGGYFLNDIYYGSIIGTLFVTILGASFFLSLKPEKKNKVDESSIQVLIPAYNDSEVIDRSIDSVLESDYGNFEITVICEPEDEKTQEKIERKVGGIDLLIEPSDEKSKAKALNYGLERTDSDYVAIFDSDQIVPEEFLKEGNRYLEDYDCYQGRVVQKPSNSVSNLSYFEHLFYTDAAKQSFRLLTGRLQPRSKAVIIRRNVLENLNGFRHGRLTEDIDFGERFTRNNYKAFKSLKSCTIIELGPSSLEDWIKHRIRWTSGFFEILLDNSKKTDWKNKFGLLGTLLGLNMIIFMLGQFFALLTGQNNYHIILPVISTSLITLSIRSRDVRNGNLSGIGNTWIYSAFIFPLLSSIMIYSISKKLVGLDTEWHRISK